VGGEKKRKKRPQALDKEKERAVDFLVGSDEASPGEGITNFGQ